MIKSTKVTAALSGVKVSVLSVVNEKRLERKK